MTGPRECCAACDMLDDLCRDQFCECHDGIASLDGDPIRDGKA